MNKTIKKIGVIVEVEGSISKIGVYSDFNDDEYIWNGELLIAPKVGAFLTINQNSIKIIASVISEKIIDEQNSLRNKEFDNSYNKKTIRRNIILKTKGVIENNKFQVTSEYVPMVGNEVTFTTKEEIDLMYGIENHEENIEIGKSLIENHPTKISTDKFFASHIGIFGNTGSGKSNTLHKLYYELFSKYKGHLKNKSQFFVIDFNGEYLGENIFGLSEDDRQFYNINLLENKVEKIAIKEKYIFNAETLSILFDAKPATQTPFLHNSINLWNKKNFENVTNFADYQLKTLENILLQGKKIVPNSLGDWINVVKKIEIDDNELKALNNLKCNSSTGQYYMGDFKETKYVTFGSPENDEWKEWKNKLNIENIIKDIEKKYENLEKIEKLKIFILFQKVNYSMWQWGKTSRQFLDPLFKRIDASFHFLSKTIKIISDAEDLANYYKTMNIFSFSKSNKEVSRLIPMLLSKMIYEQQKEDCSKDEVFGTKHLIIDEAHNILNDKYKNTGDISQDYRLSVFEEIIKEGRKFGFFLTISSQRPADISPTILSQIHNYVIHRLVNDKDIKMLENTMPTLDANSFSLIPSLGKGEAIITGTSTQMPIFVKIPKHATIRPKSDDILLTRLWNINS